MSASRPRKSPFIRYFDKTPPGIACPHFWLLSHANGCPYQCTYCYLSLTFRRRMNEWFSNLDDLEREVAAWLEHDGRMLLSSGELSDSLAVSAEWLERVYPLFARQSRHVLLLLTKSAAGAMGAYEPNESVVVSFSVNADDVSRRHERDAPSSIERLRAAYRLRRRGWRVRLRVDPMLPVPGWREAYARVAEVVNQVQPERVTLGSLRYFPGLRRRNRGFPGHRCERDGPDGRMRLPRSQRLAMYAWMIDRIEAPVGLCKEIADIVQELNRKPECNCTL